MWGVTVTSPATGQKFIDTKDLQEHCGIALADSSHDSFLDNLCLAAVDLFEQETNCHLLERTADYTVDAPPADGDPIYLPHWPVISIGDFQYVDSDGVTQTATSSDFIRSTTTRPASISLKDGKTWPVVPNQAATITIKDVKTGHATAAGVPMAVRQSILLLVAHYFENRETVIIGTNSSETPMATKMIWNTVKIRAGYFRTGG